MFLKRYPIDVLIHCAILALELPRKCFMKNKGEMSWGYSIFDINEDMLSFMHLQAFMNQKMFSKYTEIISNSTFRFLA